jgi:hypothetical protein
VLPLGFNDAVLVISELFFCFENRAIATKDTVILRNDYSWNVRGKLVNVTRESI